MTDARVSREHVEVLNLVTPDSRISREHVEVLHKIGIDIHVDAVRYEVLIDKSVYWSASPATETETALGGTVGYGIVGGLAQETESALAGAVFQTIPGGLPSEADSAQGGAVEWVGNPSGAVNANGWSWGTLVGTTGTALTRTTTPPAGAASTAVYLAAPALAGASRRGHYDPGAHVGGGTTYRFKVDAYVDAPGNEATGTIYINTYSEDLSASSGQAITLTRNAWNHIDRTFVAPADEPWVFIEFEIGQDTDPSAILYMSGYSVTTGSAVAGGPATVLGDVAVELDSALRGAVIQVIQGGRATETDEALAGVQTIFGGTAVETDLAIAGSVSTADIVFGGLAEETDAALAGAVQITVVAGLAEEFDAALAGSTDVLILAGRATEGSAGLHGTVVIGLVTATRHWVLFDPVTTETFTFPINPASMTPLTKRRELKHVRGRYGVSSSQQPKRDESLDFSGVIRSQAFYDALVTWALKPNAVILTDHIGREFRIYITDFQPTDRSPIPRAPKRWRYTMKTRLLEAL